MSIRQRWPRPAGRPRRGHIAVPSLVAGAGLALSLPPWGFWILAFPAAGLAWWRLEGLGRKSRLLAGWLVGLGLFLPGLWWSTSFNLYGGILLICIEALAIAVACGMAPSRRGRSIALPGAMVLLEALRDSWPFGGLPLGSVALGQIGGPLGRAARLGGPLLLVGLVWLGGAVLGMLAVTASQEWHHHRRRLPSGALAGTAVVVLVVAFAAIAPNGGSPVGTLRVAAVQGGGLRGLRKFQVNPAIVFHRQVEATAEIPAVDHGRPPALVLWPEDVVSVVGLLADSPDYGILSNLARKLHATLVVGVTETVSSTHFRNEVVAFAPDGQVVAHYEKVHRVPFGEYVPYRSFFSHLANLSAVPLNAIPGHGNGVLHTPAGTLGTMISFEVFFSHRGRLPTRNGATVLIVPTNDASYSTSQVPTQEIAASRLQAMSEGRDLIQAAPTGFSAFINHHGAVLQRTSLGARQVIVRDVSLRTGKTIYERFGELPVLLLAGMAVLAGWATAAIAPGDTSKRHSALKTKSRHGRLGTG